MSWIKKLVTKQKHSNSKGYDNIPTNMCIRCSHCSAVSFAEDLKNNLYTCSSCGGYFKMPLKDRLDHIFGESNYKSIDINSKILIDPIKFKSKEKYTDKISSYRKKTGLHDAAAIVYGKIGSTYSVCFVLNFDFLGGSMGVYVGEAFVKAAEYALLHKLPLIAVTASGGARMQEGIFSLMQMAKTTVVLEKLKDAKLPYVVILTNPTTGGVTASFAMLGDIQLAEEKAMIGFAGARVIEQTIRKKLPEGFQTAEYLLDKGMLDNIVKRSELPSTLAKLLPLLLNK